MEAFLADPGFEDALARELRARGAAGVELPGPGLVLAAATPTDPGGHPIDPVFARQPIPNATRIEGESIGKLAKAAFDLVAAPIDPAEAWTLHVVAAAPDAVLERRATLVAAELLALVRRLRRRSSRRLVAAADVAPGTTPLVVQVVLFDREAALVSAAVPRALTSFGTDLDPRWPGGRREIPDDRAAPSSAHKKAEEGYLLLGREPRPGERCVDLGACPGGWTWTALRRGAHVVAVDRAPLLAPAAGHPNLVEVRGDAFAHEPDAPVDWLLCDVIAVPERTIAMLDGWLERSWCRRFVVNVKFKGDDRDAALDALRTVLARREARGRVKHLASDKNEATVVGYARAPGSGEGR